jgi:hypothetical protein
MEYVGAGTRAGAYTGLYKKSIQKKDYVPYRYGSTGTKTLLGY